MPELTETTPTRQGVFPEQTHFPEQLCDAGYFLEERPFDGKISLRGRPSDKTFLKAAGKILGADLPTTPNTTAHTKDLMIFWQRPDAWLIVCAEGKEDALLEKLNAGLEGTHFLATNLTDNYTVLRLSGENVRDVLKSGSFFDSNPEAFPAGAYTQTTFAEVDVLIHAVPTGKKGDNSEIFDIYLRRSFADYVWRWLEKTCLLAVKDKTNL